jgi:hypothetical protein
VNRLRIVSLVLSLALCLLAFAALLLLSGSSAHAQSTTRYVATTGTDTSACTEPNSPCRTVQYAVDAAVDGDLIAVAAGVYTDVNHYGSLAQVIYLDKGITIRGGYTNEFVEPPDPATNLTVLDARGQGRVIYAHGDGQPTIEGVHITGGDATGLGGNPWGDDTGGGVYISSTPVLIRNSQIYSNTALFGAGLVAMDAQLTLQENRIFSNTGSYGGGLHLYGGSATVNGNTILSNTAEVLGGGIYLSRGQADLAGNTIGGNASWYGGGLFLQETDASVLENTIQANTAHEGGVGGWEFVGVGGGVYAQDCTLSLVHNTIRDNIASWGGGIALGWNHENLDGNIIWGNAASDLGGGLILYETNTTLINNVVADNQASKGSGLYFVGTSARLLHTTIARNGSAQHAEKTPGDGVGIYVAPGDTISSQILLTDTILVSHTVGITVAVGNTTRLDATLWGTGTWANGTDWAGEGSIMTGTINIWGEPSFAGAAAGDYHIGRASAARDSGIGAGVFYDVDGDPRPFGTGFDLGADEFIPYLALHIDATPDPVASAIITDVLPECVTPSGVVTWPEMSIASGETWSGNLVVVVDSTYAGPVTNVLQVGSEAELQDLVTHTAIAEIPILGLEAMSDSPTPLGLPTRLTATITAGSNVTYAWAFGDGQGGSGPAVMHTYPDVGDYLATVWAGNQVGVVTATTAIRITAPRPILYLPVVMRNAP